MNPSIRRSWFLPHAVGMALLCGCSQTPSGRTQLMLVDQKTLNDMGRQAYEQVLSESRISSDAEMTAVLRRVGQRIAAVADRPDFDWEFNLIDSEQVNAFCLPGGKIAVYTGILPVMRNEAGMAAVMGHEVGHALYNHGGERVSQGAAVEVILRAAQVGLKNSSPEAQRAILGGLGAGAQYGYQLPFSRAHELEADAVGLSLSARAGYDPQEAVRLWERMAQLSGGSRIDFLSTHPSESKRIESLQRLMPKAMSEYESAPEQYGLGKDWGG